MSDPVYPLIHRMPFYSISQNFVNIHIVLEKNHELSTYTIVKKQNWYLNEIGQKEEGVLFP